jgi:hypothetical protein
MQCGKHLDFQPRSPWPASLPVFAWQGALLCGFERAEGLAVDLTDDPAASFAAAFTACHPRLGVGELARLYPLLQNHFSGAQADEVIQFYGLRPSELLRQTFDHIRRLPMDMQNWIDDKKMGPRDLAPLLAWPVTEDTTRFLSEFIKIQLSKSAAAHALETAIDLHLMGHPLADLLPQPLDTVEAYLQNLDGRRRPRTTALDREWQAEVQKWPWPAQVQAQWRRWGDTAGLEIKLRATSAQDLKKKLDRLNSIGESWACKN